MKLTREEGLQLAGFLEGKGLSVPEAAALMDRHRTTVINKIRGNAEISPIELVKLGTQIADRETARRVRT